MGLAPFTMDRTIEPWQMHPGESSLAYSYFVAYRDLGGKRSLARAADLLCSQDPDYATSSAEDRAEMHRNKADVIRGYCGHYEWVARCKAYDAAMDREMVQARLQGQREAAYAAGQRHGHLASGLLAFAGKYLQKLHDVKDPKFCNQKIEEATFAELLAIIKAGVQLERLNLGMDTAAESAALNNEQSRVAPDEMKRIAREAAMEAIAAEPDADSIVIEPPKE